jgi:hypothetical protein
VNRLGGVEVLEALAAEHTADQQQLDAAAAQMRALRQQVVAGQGRAGNPAADAAIRALAQASAAITS